MRLVFVASRFNEEITSEMLKAAQRKAKELRVEVAEIVHVPGVYEIPLALSRILPRNDVDGAVAIGAVVKGETKHDEVIIEAAADKILDLQIAIGKPIGFGVTGPGMSWEQAKERIDRGARAVEAAVAMCESLKHLKA